MRPKRFPAEPTRRISATRRAPTHAADRRHSRLKRLFAYARFGAVAQLAPPGAPGALAPRHAHMAADAGAVVTAVDDEVVAFRLQPDGAVDGFAQQLVADRGA